MIRNPFTPPKNAETIETEGDRLRLRTHVHAGTALRPEIIFRPEIIVEISPDKPISFEIVKS